MSLLLIAEHDNSKLKVFTLNAINAASKIDGEVHVLVAGCGCENVAKEVATSFATFSHPHPATKTWTSPSIFEAALIAFKVNTFSFELSCSAINNSDIILPSPHS